MTGVRPAAGLALPGLIGLAAEVSGGGGVCGGGMTSTGGLVRSIGFWVGGGGSDVGVAGQTVVERGGGGGMDAVRSFLRRAVSVRARHDDGQRLDRLLGAAAAAAEGQGRFPADAFVPVRARQFPTSASSASGQ